MMSTREHLVMPRLSMLVAAAALVLCAIALATPAMANWFCGFRCTGSWGNGICQGPDQPTVGCSYIGGIGGCISGTPSHCGSGMGCGFDGELCPPDQQY